MADDPTTAPSAPAAARPATNRLLFKRLPGYLIAGACLVWVFHDVKFHEFAGQVKTIVWGWVGVAVLCDISSYLCQGFRWKMLLRPAGDISVVRTTQAIYVGLFTNEILPLRAGELVRMFLVSRWLKLGFQAVLPSYLVERMLDAIWLALAVGLVSLFVPIPHPLVVGEEVLGVIVLVLTAVFVFAVVRKGRSADGAGAGSSPGRGPFRFIARVINETADGLRKIGFSHYLFTAAAGSLGILVFQVLAFWYIMAAMGIRLSVWQGAVALLIVHLGTAIPNAPSNVGSYQFFTVIALAIFGVEKPVAASFSVVAFLLLTIPLWIIGLIALSRTGMSFAALRMEAARLRAASVSRNRAAGSGRESA
jgi:uncharacterized protein (TIRG00374 family)